MNTDIGCPRENYVDITNAKYGYGWYKGIEVEPINVINDVKLACQYKRACMFNPLVLKKNLYAGEGNYFVIHFRCLPGWSVYKNRLHRTVTDKCYQVNCGQNAHCVNEGDKVMCECDLGSIRENNKCIEITNPSDPRHRTIHLARFDVIPDIDIETLSKEPDENEHIEVSDEEGFGMVDKETGAVVLNGDDPHIIDEDANDPSKINPSDPTISEKLGPDKNNDASTPDIGNVGMDPINAKVDDSAKDITGEHIASPPEHTLPSHKIDIPEPTGVAANKPGEQKNMGTVAVEHKGNDDSGHIITAGDPKDGHNGENNAANKPGEQKNMGTVAVEHKGNDDSGHIITAGDPKDGHNGENNAANKPGEQKNMGTVAVEHKGNDDSGHIITAGDPKDGHNGENNAANKPGEQKNMGTVAVEHKGNDDSGHIITAGDPKDGHNGENNAANKPGEQKNMGTVAVEHKGNDDSGHIITAGDPKDGHNGENNAAERMKQHNNNGGNMQITKGRFNYNCDKKPDDESAYGNENKNPNAIVGRKNGKNSGRGAIYYHIR
eukprot:XP_001612150.1 hypothetical protein [Babesia bovis T2Bo]